jgi:hypothetical protein
LFGENCGVIPWASNPGVDTWYSWLCGEGAAPLVGQFEVEMAGGISVFFFFLFSLVLWAFHY